MTPRRSRCRRRCRPAAFRAWHCTGLFRSVSSMASTLFQLITTPHPACIAQGSRGTVERHAAGGVCPDPRRFSHHHGRPTPGVPLLRLATRGRRSGGAQQRGGAAATTTAAARDGQKGERRYWRRECRHRHCIHRDRLCGHRHPGSVQADVQPLPRVNRKGYKHHSIFITYTKPRVDRRSPTPNRVLR